MSLPLLPFRGGRKVMLGSLVVGLAALALNIIGFATSPTRALFSWLIAVIYVMTVVLGLLGFLVVSHTMDAGWPTAVRRLAEAGMVVMPLLAVMFLPILFGLSHLYPWMRIGAFHDPAIHKVLVHKAPYLNPPFFILRSIGYLVLWSACALLLRRWSLATDVSPHTNTRGRLRALSALSAPLMALSLTGAATDWIMSLAPEWVSYIFGYYFMALSLLGGGALLCLLVALCDRPPEARRGESDRSGSAPSTSLPTVTVSLYYALGRVLFTFVVLWAYTAYFNYFITWIANKPAEVRWFIVRSIQFRSMSWFIILGHFGIPFLALLTYVFKRHRAPLGAMAGWLLVAQYFEVHWLIAPERGLATMFDWWDPVAVVAVGCLSLALALWCQRGRLLAAVFDPRFEEAVAYKSW